MQNIYWKTAGGELAVGRKQAGARGQKRHNGAENRGEVKGGGREDDTVIQVPLALWTRTLVVVRRSQLPDQC